MQLTPRDLLPGDRIEAKGHTAVVESVDLPTAPCVVATIRCRQAPDWHAGIEALLSVERTPRVAD